MPELCRFDGIKISIHSNDHDPPHIHARYGEHRIKVALNPVEVKGGYFPTRKRRQLMDWVRKRNAELNHAWENLQNSQPVDRIDP